MESGTLLGCVPGCCAVTACRDPSHNSRSKEGVAGLLLRLAVRSGREGWHRHAAHLVGTNFQTGSDEATVQLRKYAACVVGDPATPKNRILLLTGCCCRCGGGDLSETGLLARLTAHAADWLHTTIVGVSLDFQTTLVEGIMKVRGANYFLVHTAGEFKQRLENAWGWKVLHVYGSPDTEERRPGGGGSIMRVNSLFPAFKSEEGVQGVVLRPPTGTILQTAPPLCLSARYVDRAGKQYESLRVVKVPPEAVPVSDSHAEGGSAVACTPASFQSNCARKAVVLARLVDDLQSWLVDAWTRLQYPKPPTTDSWMMAWQRALVQPRVWRPPQLPTSHLSCPLLPLDCSTLQQAAGGGDDGSGMAAMPPWMRRQARLAAWQRAAPRCKLAQRLRGLLQLLHWWKSEVAALGDDVMQQELL
ncbi:hypothetical protein D9Q98_002951 [Chlorella vulgaris]|uniref:Uncharacterized protein n=1 Tax=Chlorella vulgaris TaxID=3077 RepID=A0A9D4TUC0_CHLVU|nr:hypothetical protein D9Q98_002951 [Chlorella vulgaris]